MKKWLRWTLGILLGFALLITALWWEENRRGRRIWEETCTRLRALGEPLDFADLTPPVIPHDQNVASAPIFSELFKLQKNARLAVMGETFSSLRPRITKGSGSELMLRPRPGTLRPDDMGLVIEWRDYLRACFPAHVPKTEMAPTDEILQILSPWDDEWLEVQEALDRPKCRWPLEYGYFGDDGMLTYPLILARSGLAWIVQPRVVACAAHGDTENCARAVMCQWRMGRMLAADFFGAMGLNMAMEDDIHALQALQNVLPTLRFEDRQLALMQRQLATIRLAEAARSFRQGGVFFSDQARHTTPECIQRHFEISAMYQLRTGPLFEEWPDPLRHAAYRAYPTLMAHRPQGWKLADAATLADFTHDEVLPCMDETSDTVLPSRVARMAAAERKMTDTDGLFSFTRLGLHTLTPPLLAKVAHHQALVREAMLWCAIERFRLKYSRLPEKLEDLVPEFLEKLPCDPVNGLPLRYVRQGEGDYLLYSIGWNLVDEGGLVRRKREEGDWTWASDPRLIVNPDEERELAEQKRREEEEKLGMSKKSSKLSSKSRKSKVSGAPPPP